MTRLLIDTSNENCLVIFYEAEKILYQANIPIGINNTKYVVSEIKRGVEFLQIPLKDLKYIALGVGPGSYTGVRVGVIIVKTLSFALNLPIVTLSSLDGFVSSKDGQFLGIIDARSGGAYYRLGEKKGDCICWLTESKLGQLDQIEELRQVDTLVCPNSRMLKMKLEKIYGHPYHWIDSSPDIHYLIQLAEQKFANHQNVTHEDIEILYLRETQAEIELKAKNSKPS